MPLKVTKPFSVEQKRRVERIRRELGLGGHELEVALEVVPVPPPEVEPSRVIPRSLGKRQL